MSMQTSPEIEGRQRAQMAINCKLFEMLFAISQLRARELIRCLDTLSADIKKSPEDDADVFMSGALSEASALFKKIKLADAKKQTSIDLTSAAIQSAKKSGGKP